MLWPDNGVFQRRSKGLDLLGGVSMGLFYIISGFVMWLGYGHLSHGGGKYCCDCCCVDTPPGSTGCCFPCFCEPSQLASGAADATAEPPPPPPFDRRAFYWKRFARIGPLWYLGNLSTLPLYFLGCHPAAKFGIWPFWAGFGLSLFPLGLNSWTVTLFPPAGHLWSISTMTFFYLLFPAIREPLKRVRPSKIRLFAFTLYCIQFGSMAISTLIVFDPEVGYWQARAWPPNRLPVFIMGMLAARQAELEASDAVHRQQCHDCSYWMGYHRATLLFAFWMVFVSAGVVQQIVYDDIWISGAMRLGGEMVLPMLFYDLILALAYPAKLEKPPTWLHRLLSTLPFRWFANISLAVYVVHLLLIQYIVLVFYPRLEELELQRDDSLSRMPAVGIAATLPLSILVGWLLTTFYEKPMSALILRIVLPAPNRVLPDGGVPVA